MSTKKKYERIEVEISPTITARVYADQADYLAMMMHEITPASVPHGNLNLEILPNGEDSVTKVRIWLPPVIAAQIILAELGKANEGNTDIPDDTFEISVVHQVDFKEAIKMLQKERKRGK